MKWKTFAVLLAVWAGALVACTFGCADLYNTVGQDTAENGEKKMFLSCSPDNIDIDGGGSITVLVQLLYTNDSPVSDESVLLTSTLGTVAATTLTTDDEGVAATSLAPGTETGTGVVVATHGTLQTNCTVSFYQSGDNAG
jgi:hypothetical protein